MTDLIKRIFNLWVETLWILEISNVERKLERAEVAVERYEYVLKRLRKRFLELYPLEVEHGN